MTAARTDSSDSGPAALEVLGSLQLAPHPGIVSVARCWARDLLGEGDAAAYDAAACLVELFTNSYHHTDSETVTVSVSRAGPRIRVEVTDAGTASGSVPHLGSRPDNSHLEQGRGLHIVNDLTEGCWGSRPEPAGGRTTWCEVDSTSLPAEAGAA